MEPTQTPSFIGMHRDLFGAGRVTQTDSARSLLRWSAPTMHDHDRGANWYLIAGLALLTLIVISIFTRNWTLIVVLVLSSGLTYLLRSVPAPIRTIEITERGFLFEETFTAFADCRDFWIVHTPAAHELHIALKRGIDRERVIQTGSIDVRTIEATLGRFIPQRTDRSERLVDKCIRLCKL